MENLKYKTSRYSVNSNCELALLHFNNILLNILNKKKYKNIILFCIGTDKSTGDSLGPLVGYKLSNLPLPQNVLIFGTLENPVHAKNIKEYIKILNKYNKNDLIIAIDASLGNEEDINYINLGEGSIKPGAGLKKSLPYIGDLYITGIVNKSNRLDFSVIQNTRLFNVMKMADIISTGIWNCLNLISI